jgi:hypothetical protein
VVAGIAGPGDGTFVVPEGVERPGENFPIRLTDDELERWDRSEGDRVVVIGYPGDQPTHVIGMEELDAPVEDRIRFNGPMIRLSEDLMSPSADTDARIQAIDRLIYWGVDIDPIGSTGTDTAPSPTTTTTPAAPADGGTVDYSESVETPAARFERRVESGEVDIEDPVMGRGGQNGRYRVANRLLSQQGWDAAWEWFENRYRESDHASYDPGMTYESLAEIANQHDDLPSPPARRSSRG